MRAPGVSSRLAPTSSRIDAGSPASTATRRRSDAAKSSSPRIAASVTARTSASAVGPGPGREHLDHLALHERGVDVEDDQPLAPPGEPRALDGDVDPGLPGDLDEPGAQGAGRVRVLVGETSSSSPVTG